MYTHPYLGSQISSERQRERQARAEQQRLTRRLRAQHPRSRHAQRSYWRIHRALRPAFWLRTQAGA
jgi:uncharacterized protein involved in exopolysaccharide biosynthesis